MDHEVLLNSKPLRNQFAAIAFHSVLIEHLVVAVGNKGDPVIASAEQMPDGSGTCLRIIDIHPVRVQSDILGMS